MQLKTAELVGYQLSKEFTALGSTKKMFPLKMYKFPIALGFCILYRNKNHVCWSDDFLFYRVFILL